MRTPWLSLLAPLAAAGCFAVTNEVQLLRTQQPALPPGCPVNVLDEAKSPYPVEDLAVLNLSYSPGGRDAAIARLREKACYYGGDTVYAISETSRNNASTVMSAKIARKPPTP